MAFKSSPKPSWYKTLTKLARRLVVELRDRNTCQRCGKTSQVSKIDWAHVKAGRSVHITWKPWAALALCAGCHNWYDANGNGKTDTSSRRWWAMKWPERELQMLAYEHSRGRQPKFVPAVEILWLEREIAREEARQGVA